MSNSTAKADGKMKKLLSIVLLVITLVTPLTMFTSSPAHANVVETHTAAQGYNQEYPMADVGGAVVRVDNPEEVAGVIDLISEDFEGASNILSIDGDLLVFHNANYSRLKIEDKRAFMEVALNTIKRSDMSTLNKNRVFNFVADQDSAITASIRKFQEDTTPDFVIAQELLRPFNGVMSTIIGVLTLLIFMFLGLTVVVDMTYITIPSSRLIFVSSDESKTRFISDEAKVAVKNASVQSGNKTAVNEYFKKSFIKFLVIGICLLWLVGGQFYVILAWFVDVFSGFGIGG